MICENAINYKTTSDLDEAIQNAFPNEVYIYFDYAGGEIFDTVLGNFFRSWNYTNNQSTRSSANITVIKLLDLTKTL